jgi:probable HAF family extracellular repeat protein
MKFGTSTLIAMTMVAAALATPVGLTAQDNLALAKKLTQHHHYQLIDMGTFGGPQSWVSGGFEGPFATINAAGTVVGAADTSDSNPNYPNCSNGSMSCDLFGIPDPFAEHAFQFGNGSLTDLGVLAAGYNSTAISVSANGLIAGISENGVIDPITGVSEAHGVLWNRDGQIIDLGTLIGGTESDATSVNTKGQVVGASLAASGNVRAIRWTEEEGMEDLGTLGACCSIAGTINERGQISGESSLCDTCNQDAFLWDHGKMYDIPDFGGPTSFHNDLNNSGQVVGQSDLPGGANAHAFVWDKKNGVKDLGTLGGSGSTAVWINDGGDVVGGANTPGDQSFHATLWKDGKVTDLGTIDPCSVAVSINSQDQIVGQSDNCDGIPRHAFLWENGGPIVDLNTVIGPGSDLTLTLAVSVNDRGEIAGRAITPSGDSHAFLLIPCDEHHLGLDGCDYSLVEGNTAATGISPSRGIQTSAPSGRIAPMFRGPVNPMQRRFGRRLGPRYSAVTK